MQPILRESPADGGHRRDGPKIQRSICIDKKKPEKTARCWEVAEEGRAVHLEYDKAGDEVWVTVWTRKDKSGEIVAHNAGTLREKTRVRHARLVTPTGKFNVYDTMKDID